MLVRCDLGGAPLATSCLLSGPVGADRRTQGVGAVVHAAGALADGLLVTPGAARRLHSSFRPKAWGAWQLHRTSPTTSPRVFLAFSSNAALLGVPGQANYRHEKKVDGRGRFGVDVVERAELQRLVREAVLEVVGCGD